MVPSGIASWGGSLPGRRSCRRCPVLGDLIQGASPPSHFGGGECPQDSISVPTARDRTNHGRTEIPAVGLSRSDSLHLPSGHVGGDGSPGPDAKETCPWKTSCHLSACGAVSKRRPIHARRFSR
jgi:hypothetical protein